MRIREYTPADLDALRRMHATQGFGYPLPDLNGPLFVTKLVLEEDENPSTPGRELADGRAVANSEPEAAEHESRGTNRDSRITMAVLLRLTAEAYLLHDSATGTPLGRWENFLALHEAALAHAAALGLDDVQAFIPPRVARTFGRRLTRLGWVRDPWPCFSRRVT